MQQQQFGCKLHSAKREWERGNEATRVLPACCARCSCQRVGEWSRVTAVTAVTAAAAESAVRARSAPALTRVRSLSPAVAAQPSQAQLNALGSAATQSSCNGRCDRCSRQKKAGPLPGQPAEQQSSREECTQKKHAAAKAALAAATSAAAAVAAAAAAAGSTQWRKKR